MFVSPCWNAQSCPRLGLSVSCLSACRKLTLQTPRLICGPPASPRLLLFPSLAPAHACQPCVHSACQMRALFCHPSSTQSHSAQFLLSCADSSARLCIAGRKGLLLQGVHRQWLDRHLQAAGVRPLRLAVSKGELVIILEQQQIFWLFLQPLKQMLRTIVIIGCFDCHVFG